ncbi:MAG: phosphatidylserine/phosphatidylglycerophosphate/cardiolipin synthase family protein [Bacteriovoracaceae bacterium]|nr:phosphatidylserine/phosphatidylglycerophosphate/cardiolipin synthase family protein [Bacteriovoracaceae bacterium]
MKLILLALLLVTLLSCTRSYKRAPASITEDHQDYLIRLYEVTEEMEKHAGLVKGITASKSAKKISNRPTKRELDLRKTAALSAQHKALIEEGQSIHTLTSDSFPQIINLKSKRPLRNFEHELVLKDFKIYQLEGQKKMMEYPISLHNTNEYVLTLEQHLQPKKDANGKRAASPYLRSTFSCEGPFALKTFLFTKKHKAGKEVKFKWYQSQLTQQRVRVKLTQASGKCDLFFEKKDGNKYGLKIVPEHSVIPESLDKFINKFEYCSLPHGEDMGPVEKLYLTTKYRSMTCPKEIEKIRTLEDSIDGLNSKVYAMLGQNLPKEMLESKDPYYPLDFSKAPKLDAIYMSYLVFRRDFYGTVIERLIRHHAKKGTFIKIMVSKVTSLAKDKEMLAKLDTEFPNVMVHLYKYKTFHKTKSFLSQLHRTLHLKMFMTYSAENDEHNVAVLGGRNIHDGFVFKTKPDLSKYPQLVQYGEDEDFARWTDFEIELKGAEVLETLMGHYNTIFEYDNTNFFARSYSMTQKAKVGIKKEFLKDNNNILFRHLTSIPYKDGMALEKFMIEQFDAAQKSITISTPYFNLTKKLTRAIERAIQRDVKVELITRLDLEGDTADIILSDVNKKTVNRFVNNITIFEYTNPADILHSKIVLIDGRLTLIGSVNFNQRSFYHDIESTLILYSKDFNQKIDDIITIYKQKSRPIKEKQKTSLWKSLIIGIFKKEL